MGRLARMTQARVPVFTLGERIRKAREDLDYSQAELALQLGVDRKTVGNWEAGRNQPRYRDLMLLSSVANVSLEWLAGDLYRHPDVRAQAGGRADIRQESSRDTRENLPLPVAA